MEKFLDCATDKILNYLAPKETEYEVVAYGVHQLISGGFQFVSAFVFSLLWRQPLFFLILFIHFMILRPYVGGFHAETERNCYLSSMIALNLVLAVRCFCQINVWFYLVTGSVSSVILFLFSPVENNVNPLENQEKEKYGKRARIITVLFFIEMLLAFSFNMVVLYESISVGLFLIGVLIIAGKIKYN